MVEQISADDGCQNDGKNGKNCLHFSMYFDLTLFHFIKIKPLFFSPPSPSLRSVKHEDKLVTRKRLVCAKNRFLNLSVGKIFFCREQLDLSFSHDNWKFAKFLLRRLKE